MIIDTRNKEEQIFHDYYKQGSPRSLYLLVNKEANRCKTSGSLEKGEKCP